MRWTASGHLAGGPRSACGPEERGRGEPAVLERRAGSPRSGPPVPPGNSLANNQPIGQGKCQSAVLAVHQPRAVLRSGLRSVLDFRGRWHTKVSADDGGVLADPFRRALGDLTTEVQHRDAVADSHDQFDVVLDE